MALFVHHPLLQWNTRITIMLGAKKLIVTCKTGVKEAQNHQKQKSDTLRSTH